MIGGVEDLNLGGMSDEELAGVVEAARRELARRQTGEAIARDITAAVDPIVGQNLDLLGGEWAHGRVSWDGDSLTVEALPDYGDVPVPEPDEPEEAKPEARAWEAGMSVKPGDRINYEGITYIVRQPHTTAGHWEPSGLPALYEREV